MRVYKLNTGEFIRNIPLEIGISPFFFSFFFCFV